MVKDSGVIDLLLVTMRFRIEYTQWFLTSSTRNHVACMLVMFQSSFLNNRKLGLRTAKIRPNEEGVPSMSPEPV